MNFDFPPWLILIIVVPWLLGALPSVAIAICGSLLLKRGYSMPGSLLLLSGVLGCTSTIVSTVVSRFLGWSWYQGYFGYAWRGISILGGFALAIGIWLLLHELPKKDDSHAS